MSCTSASASVRSSFKPQRSGDGAGKLRHLHGVGETAAKVIGVAVSEDLGFARQAAKCPRVNDAGPVALKRSAIGVLRLRGTGAQ